MNLGHIFVSHSRRDQVYAGDLVSWLRAAGLATWTLSGPSGNPLALACDDALCVDSQHTATIQEIHLIAIHLLCAAVDMALAEGAPVLTTAGARR